jgi:phosphoribosylamine---glycine ligase
MIIGIIGSGGREHSICASIKKSNKVNKIYCIPGNAGTALIAENVDLDINNFSQIKDFIIKENLDVLIIGPEKPLVDGLVDYLKNLNLQIFGPNKYAAQLEGSKIFTKKLCKKYNIPTASFGIFKNKKDAKNYLSKCSYPIVIKADGLASGKGVYICENKQSSFEAVDEIFNGKFGEAKNVLVEEFLTGEEMSYFIITDGYTIKNFETAQDHKRVLENDKGKNTGGMGAYSPSRLINDELEKKILDKIIKPTLKGLRDDKITYQGFLYAGLMIKNGEPYLIEYNVRMGDPECQTILPKLKTDLMEIFLSCFNKELKKIKIEWNKNKSLSIVLCSKGYPDNFKKNVPIYNLDQVELDNDNLCFHAGTNLNNEIVYSAGGRVLNFISIAKSFSIAREKILQNLKILNWKNGFYRKDIGHKVINNK